VVLQVSFYFPRQKIYITVPYKNGATSALNFFVSVEKFLESKQTLIKYCDRLDDLLINQDFGVHAQTGQYSAEPFRALATKENLERADIRFFIIRDPYKRFSSFWHNRIINGPDPYFAKIYSKLNSKYNLHEGADVQKAAIEFLGDLSKQFRRPITNGHLWPQIYLTKGKWYDFLIETEDLIHLPATLANKSDNFPAFKSLELPRLNISSNSEYPLLWNDEMKSKFQKSYAADLELYQAFKKGECNSANEIKMINRKVINQIRLYDQVLISARNFMKKTIKA
jgi:hypothetical protein